MSNDAVREMKETILREYPRLSIDDKIQFSCHAGLPCFNECCGDVNIALTPYDVLRLRQRIGIGSEEFIERYALIPPMSREQRIPAVFLRMADGTKNCQFVTDKGCSVYTDRPWACRMYPVGIASGRTEKNPDGEEFYFLLEDKKCKGLQEPQTLSIREWMEDQKTGDHDAANEEFKEITLHRFLVEGYAFEPKHRQMFFMACYNLDTFREFVFESTFLNKFVIEPETVEAIRTDDLELLRFGFRWLRFALFHEHTIKINPEYEQAKKQILKID